MKTLTVSGEHPRGKFPSSNPSRKIPPSSNSPADSPEENPPAYYSLEENSSVENSLVSFSQIIFNGKMFLLKL